MSSKRARLTLAICLVVGGLPVLATGQDVVVRDLEATGPELDWTPWVSDVPNADLSGLWTFDDARSDPMVETWVDREVQYEISQQIDRIVMAFRPEDGEPNIQEYRWNGVVNSFRRDTTEVRERARWTESGRTLEVEGRRWLTTDTETIYRYSFRYKLESNRRLVLRQIDEHGETTWRFTR
ncbi:MAG: hypothetical protein GKS06_17335 [Acidobacteria bacterium]|nr:hypothetical protein [Acidobacteriota bacterium]